MQVTYGEAFACRPAQMATSCRCAPADAEAEEEGQGAKNVPAEGGEGAIRWVAVQCGCLMVMWIGPMG